MADWIGINSSHLDERCGDDGAPNTIENALDGTQRWEHTFGETHWFVIDLGQIYNVQKIRGRSNSLNDPLAVNILVSVDLDFDEADIVASGVNTWKDTVDWVEVDTTDREGRYIGIEIDDTEDAAKDLGFGAAGEPYFTIFDVYGEAVAKDVAVFMGANF